MLQFVLVQVGPSPYASVDDVWEAFAACYLQPAIESSLDGNALAGMRAVSRDCSNQTVQFVTLLLIIVRINLKNILRIISIYRFKNTVEDSARWKMRVILHMTLCIRSNINGVEQKWDLP